MDFDKRLTIVQDNRITQTARAEKQSDSLTTYQKRFLLLLISHIQKDDTDFQIEKISFSDYMRIMNISTGGNTEKKIRDSVMDLTNKNFLVNESPKKTVVCSWIDISKTAMDWENKTIVTMLSPSLKEYYLRISSRFTAFQLGFTCGFRSKYSYRVYEYLHSFLNQGKITVEKDKAFELLCDNKYSNITDFHRFVLKRAIDEINEHSDMVVRCNRIRTKRVVSHFFFTMIKKSQDELDKIRDSWTQHKSLYDEIADEISKIADSDDIVIEKNENIVSDMVNTYDTEEL